MEITVGIPHFQNREGLEKVLQGIENQILKSVNSAEVEIIVSNDEDEDLEKLINFKSNRFQIRYIYGPNGGPAVARNRVIMHSKGRYIAFLDSDSYPESDWLEQMVNTLRQGYQAVGGKVLGIPGKGWVNQYFVQKNMLQTPIIDRKTGEVVSLITANCGFEKIILDNIKGFDEEAFKGLKPGGEDVDLSYRLRKEGVTLWYQPTIVTKHEFPDTVKDIWSKGINYGRGTRRYIDTREIDPTSIRQPSKDLWKGILGYWTYRQRRIFDFWFPKKIGMIVKIQGIICDEIFLLAYIIGYYS